MRSQGILLGLLMSEKSYKLLELRDRLGRSEVRVDVLSIQDTQELSDELSVMELYAIVARQKSNKKNLPFLERINPFKVAYNITITAHTYDQLVTILTEGGDDMFKYAEELSKSELEKIKRLMSND